MSKNPQVLQSPIVFGQRSQTSILSYYFPSFLMTVLLLVVAFLVLTPLLLMIPGMFVDIILNPVFIDGRSDLFEWAGVFREYGLWAMLQNDPNTLLDKYDVSFCLLERDTPMAYVLPLMRNWTKVYLDDKSVIFVRTTAATPSKL